LEAAFNEQQLEQETNRHQRQCLREAINKLPERQKEVIYLRYIMDFKNEEIAQIMGINYQAVRNTLHKAIENLRKTISKKDLILFFFKYHLL
jgi:RNA polymerase sigma-70 factor (ECF subfamily)